MATPVDNSTWLQWMASLMGEPRQTYAATFPPDRYYCLLEELPLHLVPQPQRASLQVSPNTELVLNPACSLRAAKDLPEELSARKDLLSGFALQGAIAWVRESSNGTAMPFWLSPDLQSLLGELRANEPVPSSISPARRALLQAAAILIPSEPEDSGNGEELIRSSAAQFQEKGYAPLPRLIHPFHVAALRRYYRQQIRTGAIHLGDRQSARRYIAHNEPVAKFFHHQLTSALSRIAGRALKPSYVYLASYLSGAELKKHTDREQCDYSITFCLDYSPEPKLATPWPICLQTPRGTVQVYQMLGDGLAYRGTQLPHFRRPLPEGQTSTSIFFHYVTAEFSGPLE
jgi:hypothetical protein